MIPTPDISHLKNADWAKIYEPAEDTFCLLDALEQDAERLKNICPRLVVEIGCGSGIVSTFAAEILGSNAAVYICSDINPHAVRAAMETGKRNRKTLSPVMTNVLDSLRSRCREKIDLLLFNPPYVPTTDEEEKQAQSLASIQGSWAGGAYGTKLIETILPEITTLLAPHGHFYFVAIKQNDPNALVERLRELGLVAEICFSRRAGREHLYIIRAIRSE